MIKRRWVTLMMMDDTIFYKRKDYISALVDKRKWLWQNLQYGKKIIENLILRQDGMVRSAL